MNNYQPRAPHPRRRAAKPRHVTRLGNVMQQAGDPWRTSQRRVELAGEDLERLVHVAPADGLHLDRDRFDRFAGRVGVDVIPAGAPLAVTLDAPAEEIEALVDMGDLRLLR